MKLNKVLKFILSILIIAFILLGVGQKTLFAGTQTGTLYANIQVPRIVYEKLNSADTPTAQNKWAYGLSSSSGSEFTHPIYQILKVDSESNNANTIGKDLYCLNAEQGTTWGAWSDDGTTPTGAIGNTATYDIYSNIQDEDDIQTTLIQNTGNGSNIKASLPQIMWILDNMYLPDETKTKAEKDQDIIEYLGKAGIVKDGECILTIGGQEYSAFNYKNYDLNVKYTDSEDAIGRLGIQGYCYLDTTNNIQDVLLSEELIESVQQAAIWYYTNGYDFYRKDSWLKYKANPTDTSYSFLYNYKVTGTNAGNVNADIDVGNMLQEQANILYNYLIDNAEKAKTEGYQGTTLKIKNTYSVSQNTNGTYKISNLEITSTGLVSNIQITVKDKNNNDITSSCTIPATILEGQKFDITVPGTTEGNIKIYATATGFATTKTLWGNSGKAEQPLVQTTRGNGDVNANITITNEQVFDLALRKLITKVINNDGTEVAVLNETNGTDIVRDATRALTYNTSTIPNTATYKHRKDPVVVSNGYKVQYELRIYNEGDIPGYASKIVDQLPVGLEFKRVVSGDYELDEYITATNTLKLKAKSGISNLNPYNKTGVTLDFTTITIECEVKQTSETDGNTKHYLTNIAYISEYNKNGTIVNEDRDSQTTSSPSKTASELNAATPAYKGGLDKDIYTPSNDEYFPGQQDDDDFETLVVLPIQIEDEKFDLALRKFITAINEEAVTTRIPEVKYEDGKITYEHPKDVLKVKVGDIVTYTIRVYNEGNVDGFTQTITDDIPEYLEYLPTDAMNKYYRWKMYDNEGNETEDVNEAVKIVSDYTSKEFGEEIMSLSEIPLTENPNYLTAFDESQVIGDANPDYTEVKVAFKVKDPNSSKIVIVNKAQISEDSDENGNPIEDIDSIPNKWNEGEDDQDYENVSVEYFDLSLLKYVSEVIVKENGTTKTTKTKNNGGPKDIVPKVEVHKKKLKSTVVKFVYTIKVTNEGDIPGYATELTDYVPKGLEFYAEDNKGWTEKESGVITTTLLKDVLLNPGESTIVKVTFRWKNSASNLGVKTNVAEISKDKNEKGIPDRDSTPGNKKSGEDDIDHADVLLSIKTGLTENIIAIIGGAAVILVVLAGGVILIKKFVL